MKTMKIQNIKEKATAIVKKLGKKTITASCAVLLIGCAVILNFILFKNDNNSEPPKDMGLAINLNEITDDEGENKDDKEVKENEEKKDAEKTDGALEGGDYFATVSLGRRQARDEAMEVLLSVTESSTALPDAKEEAMNDINQIARDIENESNIETMILSKGFANCVAVVNGESANVIIESDALTPGEVAQVSEIVYEAAGVLPANLTIVEKEVTDSK